METKIAGVFLGEGPIKSFPMDHKYYNDSIRCWSI